MIYEVFAYLDKNKGGTAFVKLEDADATVIVSLMCDDKRFCVDRNAVSNALCCVTSASRALRIPALVEDDGRISIDLPEQAMLKGRYTCEMVITCGDGDDAYTYKTCDFYIAII